MLIGRLLGRIFRRFLGFVGWIIRRFFRRFLRRCDRSPFFGRIVRR